MILEGSGEIYCSDGLTGLDWLEHGFGTRRSAWPERERLALAKQIHSDIVVEASAPGTMGEADAIVTNEPGLLVGVKTADCVPVLLADARNRAVAAVHAGWRGTAREIVVQTLQRMHELYGTMPGDVLAAIGPCINRCCYEVGPEVANQFARWLPEIVPNEKQRIDLVAANRIQLASAGVPDWRISSGAPCTFCRPEQLHSFRRDGAAAGRLISAIGIRAAY